MKALDKNDRLCVSQRKSKQPRGFRSPHRQFDDVRALSFLVLFPGLSSLRTGWGGGDHCGFVRVKPCDIAEQRSGHGCKNVWFDMWFSSHFVRFSCQERLTITAVMMCLLFTVQISHKSTGKMLVRVLKPFLFLPHFTALCYYSV